jgi:hypothetical protein
MIAAVASLSRWRPSDLPHSVLTTLSSPHSCAAVPTCQAHHRTAGQACLSRMLTQWRSPLVTRTPSGVDAPPPPALLAELSNKVRKPPQRPVAQPGSAPTPPTPPQLQPTRLPATPNRLQPPATSSRGPRPPCPAVAVQSPAPPAAEPLFSQRPPSSRKDVRVDPMR